MENVIFNIDEYGMNRFDSHIMGDKIKTIKQIEVSMTELEGMIRGSMSDRLELELKSILEGPFRIRGMDGDVGYVAMWVDQNFETRIFVLGISNEHYPVMHRLWDKINAE